MSLFRLSFGAPVALVMLAGCTSEPETVGGALPMLVASGVRSEASLQALAQGRLHLDADGCLRIGEDGPFVIWPHGSRISRTGDGRVQVIDGSSGNAVHIGDEFAIAGAGVDAPPTQLTQPVPAACANGRFWLAGPVMNEADRLAMASRQQQPGARGPSRPE